MNMRAQLLALGLAAAFVLGDVGVNSVGPLGLSIDVATPAQARIGRPLTPMSYAGVARRTTRRVVRRTAVRISTLPAGCLYGPYYGGYYYRCGSVYYEKSGNVYIQVVIQ